MESRIHSHNLSPGLVEALRKFGLMVKQKGQNNLHIRRDLDFDISENNNFQKLKYWGLIAKYRVGGFHYAGWWVLTRNGASFLRNEMDMPKKVKTCENRLIEKGEQRVRITDYYENMKDEYWQIDFTGIQFEQGILF